MTCGKAAEFRLDIHADRGNLFACDLIAQEGDVMKVKHHPGADKGAPSDMPPDEPLRLQLCQRLAQLVSGCTEMLAQVALGWYAVVVPIPRIVDEVSQSLRQVGLASHHVNQFGHWFIESTGESVKLIVS